MSFHIDSVYGDSQDEGAVLESNGHVLQRQWVTLTASMLPEPTASSRGWRVTTDRLPILAAVFCGAALIFCILFAIIIYRCCIMPKKDKHYCLRKAENGQHTQVPHPGSHQSQSAVYAEPKGCSWGYINKIVAPSEQSNQWNETQCPQCPVPRSNSHPGHQDTAISTISKKQRPVSQPVSLAISNGILKQLPMPEISEFSPPTAQYASSSILDEVNGKDDYSTTFKTRSLPAWVRSKPRPLSTDDDLNNLYAKVNFSKKRKNRMRNDEAAIIALSKSRSQFLHKDTDSLVDNEAVIVYDERTAL